MQRTLRAAHVLARNGKRILSVEAILMDARETAELLNMSLTWVYRDAPKLGLKGYKFGRGRNAKIQFKKADVLNWLEQQKML
ncbi:helix-turn-helix domain-containing protein [Streptomyces noursei]|uniref:helix-turn-helix domain-containing protein n=1 Tax=Streptomyces noursei TaxID=1971 RepID=UPI00045F094E|nr:helix-turn-helix domain-containing protein [Streptomyces noursei]AIA06726.1 hypothetical protein DC74_6287 [Streptomyces noursei]